jgi:hypothetical protein
MAAQASSNTTATSTGFWDLDEPLPAVSRRLRRAGAVGGVWVLSALPVAFGWQRCPIATLLHRPCPGCGMTRAIRLLASGELGASLRMHPLAVPVLVAGALLAGSTVWTTYAAGSPVRVFRTRFGRLALGLAAVVYGALVVLWILRAVGYFGGPVPV